MDKKLFIPVTVFPGLNNVFEKILASKLSSYFQNIFCDFSSAYRRHHSRQTTLLRLVEDWKKSRDRGELVATVTMELSKALDSLPHLLLVKKVQAYGLDNRSCSFLLGYLQNKLQRVKIEDAVSSWEFASRGLPQGSILGPLFFNVFLNELAYFITGAHRNTYADDSKCTILILIIWLCSPTSLMNSLLHWTGSSTTV